MPRAVDLFSEVQIHPELEGVKTISEKGVSSPLLHSDLTEGELCSDYGGKNHMPWQA